MPVMRTAVNCWRCPISFLYCFLRLNLKTRILSPRPSSTTSPVTRAPLASVEKVLPLIASTSENSMSPPLCCVFSTLITSPGATRYCLPPERMTAYIEVSKVSPRVYKILWRGEPGFRASVDARCFLVRMGTTGKLNDYNEFSGKWSRQRPPCSKSGGFFFVGDFEDSEAFEVRVRVQFGDRHDQLKMHVLNAFFAAR